MSSILLERYFKQILSEFPDLSNFRSIADLAVEFRVTESIVMKFFRNHHETDEEKKKNITSLLYFGNYKKKKELIELLNQQIQQYYPNQKDKIFSTYKLKRIFKNDHIQKWIKKYMISTYGSIRGIEIYTEIWSSRNWVIKKISYDDIVKFVENKGGKVLTSEEEFNKMAKLPTKRKIHIEDKYKHKWFPLVNDIRIRNQWCPICQEGLCERAGRRYMEKIFKAPFPKTTLKKSYGLSKERGGSLEFDGYNGNVIIARKSYSIAYEFDGIQHDMFPNHLYTNLERYRLQQWRDATKNLRAHQFNTIIIRIKQIYGFDRRNLNKFSHEIIRQFYLATGINLKIDS